MHRARKIAARSLAFVFLALALAATATLLRPTVLLAEGTTNTTRIQDRPVLAINIPTISFSNISVTNGGGYRKIDVPWVAEYVSGVYTYAVTIAAILAGVMFLVGGFQYLTAGGDASRVSKAKERISDAMVGMLLTFGAYVTLTTINPELVSFRALNIRIVSRIDFESVLGETAVDTGSENPASTTSCTPGTGTQPPVTGGATASAVRPASGSAPGSHSSTNPTCPFTLTAPSGEARKTEFYNQVRTGPQAIRGGTVRDRVIRIADAAVSCTITMGSCGRTAGTIAALAGVGDGGCLEPPSGNCNGTYHGTIAAITQDQRRQIYGVRCDLESAADRTRYGRPDCVCTTSDATTKIRDFLLAESTAGRLPGWPDQWADALRPGDYVVIYNGNRDLVGAHAVTFVGWASPGVMQVVQGSAGRPTFTGTWCVKRSCGDRMKPLLYIRSPD